MQRSRVCTENFIFAWCRIRLRIEGRFFFALVLIYIFNNFVVNKFFPPRNRYNGIEKERVGNLRSRISLFGNSKKVICD